MSASDDSAERALRYFRREFAWDVEELRIYEEDHKRMEGGVFQPYKLPCLGCGKKFMYHNLGTKGRGSVLCSDACEDKYGNKEEEEEDWEECMFFE